MTLELFYQAVFFVIKNNNLEMLLIGQINSTRPDLSQTLIKKTSAQYGKIWKEDCYHATYQVWH